MKGKKSVKKKLPSVRNNAMENKTEEKKRKTNRKSVSWLGLLCLASW